MGTSASFLFDVDNTLIDNDRVKADLAKGIEPIGGGEAAGARFWEIYEDVRRTRDFVDYPTLSSRFRKAWRFPTTPASGVGELVLVLPYRSALYPDALEVLTCVQTIGPAAIVTRLIRCTRRRRWRGPGWPMRSSGGCSLSRTRSRTWARCRRQCRPIGIFDVRGQGRVLAMVKRMDDRAPDRPPSARATMERRTSVPSCRLRIGR